MPAITAYSQLNLAEVNKRAGYDDAAAVLGPLAKSKALLEDMPWYEASNAQYHKSLAASRLGSGAFSQVNSGISRISSGTEENVDPVKMYEADGAIDERVLNFADDKQKARDSEDVLNLEGFIQAWIDALFHNAPATAPNSFNSFDARRAALGTYCIGGSGTGSDLTSVWLMELGPQGVHMRYPKGGTPGLKNEDRGRQYIAAPDATGNMWAWIRHYEMIGALIVRDPRALLRYANIETAGSSNLFSPDAFIGLKNKLPNAGTNAVAYVNRTIKSQIEVAAYNKTNVVYSIRELEGFGAVPFVAGVPVRLCDIITETESALV